MIRKAEEKDAPRVLELLQDIVRLHHEGRPDIFSGASPKYDEAALREKFRNENERIFVSVDANVRVNGYVMCVLEEKDEPFYTQRPYRTLYVDDLCVDNTCRGQGVGRALMERAVEAAKELHCYNLDLNVWACNEDAIRFYEAIGMQKQRQYMEIILDTGC